MIDKSRIENNLKEFSFPRLSGTEFEKKSFNIMKQKIEDLNLIPLKQEFSFVQDNGGHSKSQSRRYTCLSYKQGISRCRDNNNTSH